MKTILNTTSKTFTSKNFIHQKYICLFLLLLTGPLSSFAQIDFDDSYTLNSGYNGDAVEIADMNNDGLEDVIILNASFPFGGPETHRIHIYYQGSNGIPDSPSLTFNTPSGSFTEGGMEIVDMDNNGLKDVVMIGSYTIAIAYQQTANNFNFTSLPDIFNWTGSVAVGDLNGDGLADLVYPVNSQYFHEIAYQQDDHTFTTVLHPSPTKSGVSQMKLVDLNNDGKKDLVFGNNYVEETIYIQMQVDTGLQTNYQAYLTSLETFEIGDVNNDGLVDLIAHSSSENKLSIYHQNPDTAIFEEQYQVLTINSIVADIKLDDINCDGYTDIVTVRDGYSGFSVYPGSAFGFSTYTVHYLSGNCSGLHGLALGNLNNDNFVDVLLTSTSSGGTEGANIAYNISTPTLSDYEIVDTLSTITFLNDTSSTQELAINLFTDSSGTCTITYTDSLLITTTTIESEMTTENTFQLEANMCEEVFYESIQTNDVQDLPPVIEIDTLIISASIDTFTVIDLISQASSSDTFFLNLVNRDSSIVIDENQFQSGDTTFTVIDSFWNYNIYELYEVTFFDTIISEITMCGLTYIDTLMETTVLEVPIFVSTESDFISETIVIDILDQLGHVPEQPLLKLFPNPTSGHFRLEIPKELTTPFEVVATNIQGQRLFQKSYYKPQDFIHLDWHHLPKGFYQIILTSKKYAYTGFLILH